MALNNEELLGLMDTLATQLPTVARNAQTEQASFSDVLSGAEREQYSIDLRAKTVVQQAQQATNVKFAEYTALQKEFNEAGPFHDIAAFFTGGKTKQDIVEEQEMLAMQTKQIANNESYQKNVLAFEQKALETKTRYGELRYNMARDQISNTTAVSQLISQNAESQDRNVTRVISDAYSLRELQDMERTGKYPAELVRYKGRVHDITQAKLNALYRASDAKNRTSDETLIARFNGDVESLRTSVGNARAKGSVPIGPDGAPVDVAQAARLLVSYDDNVAKLQLGPAAGIGDPQDDYQTLVENTNRINNITVNAPYVLSAPGVGGAVRQLQTATSRGEAALTQILAQQGDPNFSVQMSQYARTVKPTVRTQEAMLAKLGKSISDANGGGAIGEVATTYAMTNSLLSNDPKATSSFVFMQHNKYMAPGLEIAGGGVLFADIYRPYLDAQQAESNAAIKGNDKFKQFDDGSGTGGQMGFLAMIMAGREKEVPTLQMLNNVLRQPDTDDKGNPIANSFKYRDRSVNRLADAMSVQAFQATMASFPHLEKEFKTYFKDAIEPATGTIAYETASEFVNQIAKFEALMLQQGKIKQETKVLDTFRKFAVPETNLDADWNRMYDNVYATVGPGARLLLTQMFAGEDRKAVHWQLSHMYMPSNLNRTTTQADVALNTDAARKVAIELQQSNPSLYSTTKAKPADIAQRMRTQMTGTYSSAVIDETLKQLGLPIK